MQELRNEMPAGMAMETGSEFTLRLGVLKHSVVRSLQREMSAKCAEPRSLAPRRMDYAEFLQHLDTAGLPQLRNRAVFDIFDTGHTGESVAGALRENERGGMLCVLRDCLRFALLR